MTAHLVFLLVSILGIAVVTGIAALVVWYITGFVLKIIGLVE